MRKPQIPRSDAQALNLTLQSPRPKDLDLNLYLRHPLNKRFKLFASFWFYTFSHRAFVFQTHSTENRHSGQCHETPRRPMNSCFFLYGCCVFNQVLHLNTNVQNMPLNPRLPQLSMHANVATVDATSRIHCACR